MIGFITRGDDFAGLFAYLYGPGSANEHVNARAVGWANTAIVDPARYGDVLADMNYCASLNTDVELTAWHCSISAAPGDRHIDDDEWGQIAGEHVANMGFGEAPWVAVRHGDNHVHLVVSRVDMDGACWNDSHEKRRNKKSMRKIERRHKLTVVDENYVNDDPNHAKVPKGEREKAKRERRPMPPRAMLRDEIRGSVRAARGRGAAAWEKELDRKGIKYRRNLGRAGRLRGYSVTLGGTHRDSKGKEIWYRTSQLDKELVWHKIAPELTPKAATPGRTPTSAPVSAIIPRTPR